MPPSDQSRQRRVWLVDLFACDSDMLLLAFMLTSNVGEVTTPLASCRQVVSKIFLIEQLVKQSSMRTGERKIAQA